MNGKRIGYVRVSTADQKSDRQLEGIQLDKKFIDYSSAKSINRPELKCLLDFVREDDSVLVHSMDRLARNVKDLKSLVDFLVSKSVKVQFLKENLTFTGDDSPMSNLLLHIMGAFAEFEHAFIMERQREGIAIAKKNGAYLGTKKKLSPEKIEILKVELLTHKSRRQIAKMLGISTPTLYRYIGLMPELKSKIVKKSKNVKGEDDSKD